MDTNAFSLDTLHPALKIALGGVVVGAIAAYAYHTTGKVPSPDTLLGKDGLTRLLETFLKQD